jgi:TrpR-related protein YerC/YecD
MAKVNLHKKFSVEDTHQILVELCYAFDCMKNPEEAALLLADLLTPAELSMISLRLQIAKLLLKKVTYREIQRDLKVGCQTITRVSAWLDSAGDGFKLLYSRQKNVPKQKSEGINNASRVFKRYPLYFWPELAIAEIMRKSSNKERKQILQALHKVDIKPELYKEIEHSLRTSHNG